MDCHPSARRAPGDGFERGDGVCRVDKTDILCVADVIKSGNELRNVAIDAAEALGELLPDAIRSCQHAAGGRIGNRIFAGLAGHLGARCDREHCLGRERVIEPERQLSSRGRCYAAGRIGVRLDAPIMEQGREFEGAQIENCGCVARHALVHGIKPGTGITCNTGAARSLADGQ